jgi:hypothetical protein
MAADEDAVGRSTEVRAQIPRGPRNVSPELVQALADKVYALLLRDLRVERERVRRRPTGGGLTWK